MDFTKLFNKYYDDLKCSNSQLSKLTDISPTVISRLKYGDQVLSSDSKDLFTLCKAFTVIGKSKGVNIDCNSLYKSFHETLSYKEIKENIKNKQFSKNLNILLTSLSIKNSKLARVLKIDPSYISRIRNGKRSIPKKEMLIKDLTKYLLLYYFSDEYIKIYSNLFKVPRETIIKENFSILFSSYLLNFDENEKATINEFISNFIDYNNPGENFKFNLSEKLNLKKQKKYFGIKEAEKGIIDFFLQVLESEGTGDIIMYNNYNSAGDKSNEVFIKQWYFLMNKIIEKGHKIYKIHIKKLQNDNFINELILWLPLYLKGHAFAYVLEDYNEYITKTLLYTAKDIAVLSGETSVDFNDIMLVRTTKDDIRTYYVKKNQKFLESAFPIGKLYSYKNEDEYFNMIKAENEKKGYWLNILTSPSLMAVSDTLIDKLLNDNNISSSLKLIIKKRLTRLANENKKVLKKNKITDYFPFYTKDEFLKTPVRLALNRLFIETGIYYEYKDYLEHLENLKDFTKNNKNYSFILLKKPYFNSLELFIHHNNSVISLNNEAPYKSLSIYNGKAREVLEQLEFLITSYILKN